MNQIRARSRALTPSQQKQHQQLHPGATTGQPSLLKTGPQAEQARIQESERQYQTTSRARGPRRLWVPFKGDESDRTKEYIILDSNIQDCPCFYEHALLNQETGRRDLMEMCLKDTGQICPICEKFGDSYFVQMISVIVLLESPYITKDGTELWHMKNLLPVKYQQQETFANLCNDTFGGNMRGARIVTTRDANQRSHAIGVPRPYIENGQVVQYTEQELLNNFGHGDILNQDGKVVREANSDIYPFNYQELFPTPTVEELRMRYGGTIPAGSTQERSQVWGGDTPQGSHQDRVTSRDIKRTMQTHQADNSYMDDLDDEIPF